MSVIEDLSLSIIKFARKYFRNTWVHKIPVTSWIYRKVFALSFSEPEREVEFRGNKYLLPTKDTSMVPSIMNQDYEIFELDIFNKILKPGMVVLDIGANLGIYSSEASKAVGSQGKVYSFEPIPENLRYLKHNLNLNKAGNVEIVPCAVGAKTGKEKIYLSESNVGTHSMGGKSGKYIEVKTDTIDSFVKRRRIDKIDLIKIDVEGYESQALSGAKKILAGGRVPMLIEFSANHLVNCGTDPARFAQELLNMYRHCFIVDERKHSLKKARNSKEVAKLINGNLLLSGVKYSNLPIIF